VRRLGRRWLKGIWGKVFVLPDGPTARGRSLRDLCTFFCVGEVLAASVGRCEELGCALVESTYSDEVPLLWFCPGPSC
jgi:hypothetical protein